MSEQVYQSEASLFFVASYQQLFLKAVALQPAESQDKQPAANIRQRIQCPVWDLRLFLRS